MNAALPPMSPANYAAAIPPQQGPAVMPQQPGMPSQPGMPPMQQPMMPMQAQANLPPQAMPMPSPQMMQRAAAPVQAPMDDQRNMAAQSMANPGTQARSSLGRVSQVAATAAKRNPALGRTAVVERPIAPAAPSQDAARSSFREEWNRLSAEEKKERLRSRRAGSKRSNSDRMTVRSV